MGTKKRTFYSAPQKRVKQKRKDQYTDLLKLPKPVRYRKSLEFSQKLFINKKLRSFRHFVTKSVFVFYNNILKPLRSAAPVLEGMSPGDDYFKVISCIIAPDAIRRHFKITKRGGIRLYKEGRLIALLISSFFKLRSLYLLDFEAQTLFYLGNRNQQYFLSTLGINYPFFRTMSSGRCLRKTFGAEVSKSLKKSSS